MIDKQGHHICCKKRNIDVFLLKLHSITTKAYVSLGFSTILSPLYVELGKNVSQYHLSLIRVL